MKRLLAATPAAARGFTLLEVVLVLAIISIMAGLLAPMAYQLLMSERTSAVEGELSVLHAAIVGDPAREAFGYVGDVGKLPASLLDLIEPPSDETGSAVRGWSGPYLRNPRLEAGQLLDPFGRPWEYYLRPLDSGVGNQLALVSRGPDGESTNTAPRPNVAADWVGPVPTDPGYAQDRRNADNTVLPAPSGPNALNVVISGALALNVLNFDANPRVNAFVPGCPQLFTVSAESTTRGTMEARLPWVPGLQIDLIQGRYRATIAAEGRPGVAWTESLAVSSAGTLSRTLNLAGLDSRGTPAFNLAVRNGLADVALEVFEFDERLDGRVKPGESQVFAPHGCAQISVKPRGKSAILDQFVMPYGPFARNVGAPAASVTGVSRIDERLLVFRNQVLVGVVPRGDLLQDEGAGPVHVKTWSSASLTAGDLVEIRSDRDLRRLVVFPLAPGHNAVTVQ
jgi:general secretion pathway protein G